jgi:hypothetical protein
MVYISVFHGTELFLLGMNIDIFVLGDGEVLEAGGGLY